MNEELVAELTLAAGQDRTGSRTTAWQRDASGGYCPLIGPLWSVRKPTETAREMQRTGARKTGSVGPSCLVLFKTRSDYYFVH